MALFFSGGAYDSSEKSFLFLYPTDRVELIYQQGVDPWQSLIDKTPVTSTSIEFPEWVGFLSYELGAFSDTSKQIPYHPHQLPLACFFKPSLTLILEHTSNSLSALITPEYIGPPINEQLLLRWIEKGSLLQELKYPLLKCIGQETQESFCYKVLQAKEHILEGNIYQVNLSHRTLFQGQIDPFSLFRKVSSLNPAPFSSFIRSPFFDIISASPERFVRKKGPLIETRPIKGTHRRGRSPAEDRAYRKALITSPKEKAELLMITDLMRNDFGKVSLPGRVRTPELYRLDTYQNVFHLSSLVTAEVSLDVHPLKLIRSFFPGGSISGCPKLRALEIIYELERRARNIYTGSLGYLTSHGNFDFSIAIRTCLYHNELLELQLGAGIVTDSKPEGEFHETLYKGKPFFEILSPSFLNTYL
ncbi:MAG: anthranilate synthase component I family protein [Parachlamydiaceae bacterium]